MIQNIVIRISAPRWRHYNRLDVRCTSKASLQMIKLGVGAGAHQRDTSLLYIQSGPCLGLVRVACDRYRYHIRLHFALNNQI